MPTAVPQQVHTPQARVRILLGQVLEPIPQGPERSRLARILLALGGRPVPTLTPQAWVGTRSEGVARRQAIIHCLPLATPRILAPASMLFMNWVRHAIDAGLAGGRVEDDTAAELQV